MVQYVRMPGRYALRCILYPVALLRFLLQVRTSVLDERGRGYRMFVRFITLQIYFTGYHALPVVTLSAVALGAVFIGNAILILQPVGQMDLALRIVPSLIVREMGPVIISLIVIGRSGTAVTTELGNMVVNREIEVMGLLGIDVRYLIVFPRLIGITMGVIALAVYFTGFAIIGGGFVIQMINLAPVNFSIARLFGNIGISDMLISVAKCGLIGVTVSLIHCYHGLSVSHSSTEVPQQTTRAVVNSILCSFFINGLVFMFAY